MRAVLSCAGAYVSGAAGSNECPAGSVRIETEAACRTAAAATGKPAGSPFVETLPGSPRGCYWYISFSTKAYFNTHAVGAGESCSEPLCAAAATAGAPSRRALMRAARVHRRVQRHCARVCFARTHARTLEQCVTVCCAYSRGTRRRPRAVSKTVWG